MNDKDYNHDINYEDFEKWNICENYEEIEQF